MESFQLKYGTEFTSVKVQQEPGGRSSVNLGWQGERSNFEKPPVYKGQVQFALYGSDTFKPSSSYSRLNSAQAEGKDPAQVSRKKYFPMPESQISGLMNNEPKNYKESRQDPYAESRRDSWKSSDEQGYSTKYESNQRKFDDYRNYEEAEDEVDYRNYSRTEGQYNRPPRSYEPSNQAIKKREINKYSSDKYNDPSDYSYKNTAYVNPSKDYQGRSTGNKYNRGLSNTESTEDYSRSNYSNRYQKDVYSDKRLEPDYNRSSSSKRQVESERRGQADRKRWEYEKNSGYDDYDRARYENEYTNEEDYDRPYREVDDYDDWAKKDRELLEKKRPQNRPKTSVKVQNPPGGKGSFIFG